jgi:hypothetical protein
MSEPNLKAVMALLFVGVLMGASIGARHQILNAI